MLCFHGLQGSSLSKKDNQDFSFLSLLCLPFYDSITSQLQTKGGLFGSQIHFDPLLPPIFVEFSFSVHEIWKGQNNLVNLYLLGSSKSMGLRVRESVAYKLYMGCMYVGNLCPDAHKSLVCQRSMGFFFPKKLKEVWERNVELFEDFKYC